MDNDETFEKFDRKIDKLYRNHKIEFKTRNIMDDVIQIRDIHTQINNKLNMIMKLDESDKPIYCYEIDIILNEINNLIDTLILIILDIRFREVDPSKELDDIISSFQWSHDGINVLINHMKDINTFYISWVVLINFVNLVMIKYIMTICIVH
jgi:hypothetical protein